MKYHALAEANARAGRMITEAMAKPSIMSNLSATRTLEDAVALARRVEKELTVAGWHCALTGSCLYLGQSEKDVDLIVYPHKCPRPARALGRLHAALKTAGLYQWRTCKAVRADWAKRGIRDQKHVEVWMDRNLGRVDIMVLS